MSAAENGQANMEIYIYTTKQEMGVAAGHKAAGLLRDAIDARGEANLILATGASQFEMLAALTAEPVDWSRVTAFHLDEYVGLPADHPASFRRYLRERFVEKVPALRAFHFIDPGDDPAAECRRLGEIIRQRPIDVACVGIGENGHLAFNDPPADFETDQPYIVVDLDEACRRQQLGEGWFETLDDVPARRSLHEHPPDHGQPVHRLHRARPPKGPGRRGTRWKTTSPTRPGDDSPGPRRLPHVPGRAGRVHARRPVRTNA